LAWAGLRQPKSDSAADITNPGLRKSKQKATRCDS
jgi:hypothetical protein